MALSDEFIDEALRGDRGARPAPFFRRVVMRRIHADAVTPPLVFPWKVIGIAAAAGAIAGAVVSGYAPELSAGALVIAGILGLVGTNAAGA